MKRLFVTLVTIATSLTLAAPLFAQAAKPARCATPAHHQFDFNAGDWDTYDVSDSTKIIARTKVESILGGCAQHERYEDVSGLTGESYSTFDATRNRWHQSWVTNHGQLLLIDGTFANGRMKLSGNYPGPGAKNGRIRAVWYVHDGGVRQTADTSSDGGKTWHNAYDIIFRPHRK